MESQLNEKAKKRSSHFRILHWSPEFATVSFSIFVYKTPARKQEIKPYELSASSTSLSPSTRLKIARDGRTYGPTDGGTHPLTEMHLKISPDKYFCPGKSLFQPTVHAWQIVRPLTNQVWQNTQRRLTLPKHWWSTKQFKHLMKKAIHEVVLPLPGCWGISSIRRWRRRRGKGRFVPSGRWWFCLPSLASLFPWLNRRRLRPSRKPVFSLGPPFAPLHRLPAKRAGNECRATTRPKMNAPRVIWRRAFVFDCMSLSVFNCVCACACMYVCVFESYRASPASVLVCQCLPLFRQVSDWRCQCVWACERRHHLDWWKSSLTSKSSWGSWQWAAFWREVWPVGAARDSNWRAKCSWGWSSWLDASGSAEASSDGITSGFVQTHLEEPVKRLRKNKSN